MSTPQHSLVLPDFHRLCAFPSSANSNFRVAGAESAAWFDTFARDIFAGSKRAFVIASNTGLLSARIYPLASFKEFRTCCDFINILFAIDEVCDELSGTEARDTALSLVKSVRDNTCDQTTIGKISADFASRFADAGPHSRRRFGDLCAEYVESIAYEAEVREKGLILTDEEYKQQRRRNSAVPLAFGLLEYTLGIDLPDEVFEDPSFAAMYWAAVDMICWSNDAYSYAMERSKGLERNNIVTILMETRSFTLQEAFDCVEQEFEGMMGIYHASKSSLPSWNVQLDADARRFISAIEHTIAGFLEWSFETPRYFGRAREEIKRTRVISIA